MVTHIVIFSWKVGVTDEQVDAFGQALSAMAAEIGATETIRHGRDLAFRDGNGDYALVASFPDRAGWDAYQANPAHKAFVRDHVAPIQASRLTIQF